MQALITAFLVRSVLIAKQKSSSVAFPPAKTERETTPTNRSLVLSPHPNTSPSEKHTTYNKMLRPRLRIPRIGRIGLSAQGPAPQLAPLAQSFQQQSRIQQSRSKHTVPPLSLDIANGIDGFLSAGSTEMAWTQYQTLMLEKLDQKTAGTFGQAHDKQRMERANRSAYINGTF